MFVHELQHGMAGGAHPESIEAPTVAAMGSDIMFLVLSMPHKQTSACATCRVRLIASTAIQQCGT